MGFQENFFEKSVYFFIQERYYKYKIDSKYMGTAGVVCLGVASLLIIVPLIVLLIYGIIAGGYNCLEYRILKQLNDPLPAELNRKIKLIFAFEMTS